MPGPTVPFAPRPTATGSPGDERARAQRLSYGAVQRRGTTDHLAASLADRPVERLDPPLRAALRLGLFELAYSGDPAAHAVVGEAVALARGGMRAAGGRRAGAAAGLVNAVLRRASADPGALLDGLDDSTPEGAAVVHSYPEWLARRWWEELGPRDAVALMAAMNEPAERALRVNTLRADPAAFATLLADAGQRLAVPEASDPLLRPGAALVTRGRWVPELRDAIERGEAVAQSRASQAVVSLLDPGPGERVLDLCAGPGIKSTAIAALIRNRGEVRCGRARRRAAPRRSPSSRSALGAGCVRPERADAGVLDVGCGLRSRARGSALHRPWSARVTPGCALAEDGRPGRRVSLLCSTRSWSARPPGLRPGGTLVYSTCTISRAENEEVVKAVLEADADPRGRRARRRAPRPRLGP